MRIRKRAVPFPLSSLLPGPISDPLINLNRPAPVQLHRGGPSSAAPDRPIVQGDGCDFSDKGEEKKRQDCSGLLFQEEDGEKKKKNKSNDNSIRNDNHNISSAQAVSASASPQVPVPPKKRRGSTSSGIGISNNVAGKRGRGGAVMEGSRCSRVNGRGWRCCQQTLVGYSLCEHHLGKARLRSITAVVPNRPPPPTLNKFSATEISIDPSPGPSVPGGGDDEVKGNNNKTRIKLGVVKARSISSLLGQTNDAGATTDQDNIYTSS